MHWKLYATASKWRQIQTIPSHAWHRCLCTPGPRRLTILSLYRSWLVSSNNLWASRWTPNDPKCTWRLIVWPHAVELYLHLLCSHHQLLAYYNHVFVSITLVSPRVFSFVVWFATVMCSCLFWRKNWCPTPGVHSIGPRKDVGIKTQKVQQDWPICIPIQTTRGSPTKPELHGAKLQN